VSSKQLKVVSAGIGAAAVIAMGALGAVFTAASNDTQTVVQGPEITLGETTTSTTAPAELETPVAVPEVTAEPAPEA
jgi:hypothetical protein